MTANFSLAEVVLKCLCMRDRSQKNSSPAAGSEFSNLTGPESASAAWERLFPLAVGDIYIARAAPEDSQEREALAAAGKEELKRHYVQLPELEVLGELLKGRLEHLVAYRAGKLVGTVSFYQVDERLSGVDLCVHPDYRKQGVATALMNALEQAARLRGVSRLSLFTIKETGNVEIFERRGFKIVGARRSETCFAPEGMAVTEVEMEKQI